GYFYKADPGSRLATRWVETGTSNAILGINADEQSGRLLACSSPLQMGGPPPSQGIDGEQPAADAEAPTPPPPSAPGRGDAAVLAYDLISGDLLNQYPLPNPSCGDIAIGADGEVYVTSGSAVVRLLPGAETFETWVFAEAFDGEPPRLNAIAAVGGNVYL